MTAHPPQDSERDLAFGLADALERALEPGATPEQMRAAREGAGILLLDPLGVLLREFEPHVGGPWPPELEPVRDRLLRTAARCRDEGSIEPFREAGPEWAALTGELAAIEWSEIPALGRDIATVALARVLDEVPAGEADAAAWRVRLAAPVAASLRAALDWLAGSAGFVHPLRLRAEDSVLEISGEELDPAGLDPAQRMLATVDGSLGPNPRPGESGWSLRVPAVCPRDHYLMMEQGSLRLAIPWHSVLRLQTVASSELEARARALGFPVLEPLAPLAGTRSERPVITVAHGLRRGWLIADRVIWRLAGEPCESDAESRSAGLERAVRTDEGEVFAVASSGILLAGVPVSDALIEALTPPRPFVPSGVAAEEPVAVVVAEEPVAEMEALVAELEAAFAEPVVTDDAVMEAVAAEPPVEAAIAPEEPIAREVAHEDEVLMTLDARHVTRLSETGAPEVPPPAEAPEPESEALPAEIAPVEATPVEALPTESAPVESALTGIAASEIAAMPETERGPAPLTVLIVEDAFASQAFLSRTLSDRGFEVVLADRARELDRLIESRAWSLVLLDVELPDASGPSFLRAAVERFGRREGAPPVVALVRDRHDLEMAAAAGLTEWLEKPVDERALVRLIERLAAAHRLSA